MATCCEVGFGTGLNLAHYPEHVRRLTTVDPNPGMNKLARRRIAASGIEVDQRRLGGEALPFDEGSFDCVVSTWTMCSIPEVDRALGEVRRVLRPGGRLVFLEHGQSDDPEVRAWQRRLNRIERVLGDGCRLDLDVEAAVRGQPFGQIMVERFEMERVPRTHGTLFRGFGVKSPPPASPMDLPPSGRWMDRRRLDDPTVRETRASGRRCRWRYGRTVPGSRT